jgi:hypothetical protein
VSVGSTLVLVEVDVDPVTVRVDQCSSHAAVRGDGQRDRVSRVPSSGADSRLRTEFIHTGILPGIVRAGSVAIPDVLVTGELSRRDVRQESSKDR